jgi:hypothetical protein
VAKIKARGDQEVARRSRYDGAVLVFTVQGRVLHKLGPQFSLTLYAKGWTRARFDGHAAERGYL